MKKQFSYIFLFVDNKRNSKTLVMCNVINGYFCNNALMVNSKQKQFDVQCRLTISDYRHTYEYHWGSWI